MITKRILSKVSLIRIILGASDSSSYSELTGGKVNSGQKAYLFRFRLARIFLAVSGRWHNIRYDFKEPVAT